MQQLKLYNVEGYVPHFKSELKSAIKGTKEVDTFLKEYCQTNRKTLKVATSRFENLLQANSVFFLVF